MSFKEVFTLLGGRKMTLALVTLLIFAFHKVLGLDQETMETMLYLVLGSSGAIALEDSVRTLTNK